MTKPPRNMSIQWKLYRVCCAAKGRQLRFKRLIPLTSHLQTGMVMTGMATSSSCLLRGLARGPLFMRQLSLGSSMANKVRDQTLKSKPAQNSMPSILIT